MLFKRAIKINSALEKRKCVFFKYMYVLVFIVFSNLFSLLSAETLVTNTATVNFSVNNSLQQLSDSVQFTKDTVVVPPDEITLSKQANTNQVEVGNLISYTLAINNPNATPLTNLIIQDILPLGLSYVLGSAKLNNSTLSGANVTLSGNLLSLSLGTIPANTTWTVSYQSKALNKGLKLNKATAITDTATSVIAQVSVEVVEPVIVSTLPISISKQANKDKVSLGGIIEYTVTINNPNNKTINNLQLNDNLPSGLSYVSNSALLNNLAIVPNTASGLTFNLGVMPANAQWILTYQTKLVSINGATSLVNSAQVISTESAANSNIGSDTVEISDDKILINKVANKTKVSIGDTVLYTVTVENPEEYTLSNIVISDILPTGFIYLSGSATLNGIVLANSAVQIIDDQLFISIQFLEKGKNANINYLLKVSDKAPLGSAINSVQADSDLAQSTTATATVIVATPIHPLTIEKTADVQKVKKGDLIEFQLVINNPNDKVIENITIIDLLPDGLEYIDGSSLFNGISITANTNNGLAFYLDSIPADASWLLSYKTRVTDVKGVKTVTNKAHITTKDSIADSTEAAVSIEFSDDEIMLTKSANKEKAEIGDTITYSIIVKNIENHRINNIAINDVLPLGFTYQKDTATLNGKKLISSKIQVSNNKLLFTISSMRPEESNTLTYKVLVAANAKIGNSTNTAYAQSDLAQSGIAAATVKVRTPSTIKFLKINENGIDTFILPTSYNNNQNGGKHWQEIDSIILANGTKISLPNEQPLIQAGEYTLLDPIVIEVMDLDQNKDPTIRETIIVVIEATGTSDKEILLLQETLPDSGQFIGVIKTTTDSTKLQDGILSLNEGNQINATYYDESDSTDTSASAALIVPNTQLVLNKIADKEEASIGELVRYTLTFTNNSNYSIPNLNLVDTLPLGFRYIPNSSIINGTPLKTGLTTSGRSLNFSLGKMAIGQTWTLEYLTKISVGVQIGNAINVAYIQTEEFKSNNATATVKIKDDLMRSKNILTGRVYIGCKTGNDSKLLENVRIFNEKGRSILTDNNGFWHMEGVEPGTHVLQLDSDSLPLGYEAVLCHENTRFAENPSSQFVNLQAGTLWQVNFHVKRSSNFKGITKELTNKKKTQNKDPSSLFGKKYLETTSKGFEILWPKNDYVPNIASTKIYVKSSPKHRVKVFLNGKKVSPLNYDGSSTNKARTVIIRRWLGVDINIKNRENTLLVITKDKSGKEVARKTHNIHFSGEPASAEFLPEESLLIADGKTTPVIALLIRDKDGFPMRANTHGSFTIENSRYQIKTPRLDKDELNLNEAKSGSYKYQIEENGIARIELNPTTQSGEVKLNLKFINSKDKSIRAWLKPKLRKWILVGLAEGTIAHKSISGNMQALDDLDKSETFYKRGRIAFFAKGKVKGKYLLTIAYDTHKTKQEVGSQLEGSIDPDAWYTLYADNSNNQYNAPSSEKLYLKIEKDNFYALFGDFKSNMNVTELAKYERTLNGIKSEYQGEKFGYNAFISETSNNHHHDEFQGDGTSGLYHLSHSILSNSETIKIETRDRFHSERILETKQLARYQDYQIDYESGALFFKSPITSKDQNLNPNFIVIDYDSKSDNNKEIVAGGRATYKTDNQKLEIGVSTLYLGRNKTRSDSLVAIDTTYKISPDTKLKVEIAQSKTEKSQHKTVTAQILELEKQITNMETKIYYRKQGENFGIDSQASESGTQKVGAELSYTFNKKTKLNAEISHQKNLVVKNNRFLAEVEVDYKQEKVDLSAGLRHTQEVFTDQSDVTKNTILLGAKYTTESKKMTVRGDLEKSIDSSSDKILLGVDIKLQQGTTLFAEHEITDNSETITHSSRVGLNRKLWEGAKAKTTYTKERTDQGQRNYATLGLSQRLNITDKIKADFSIDHAKTIGEGNKQSNDIGTSQQASNDDFTAFSIGLGSNEKNWSWTSRFEIREGDFEDKVSIFGGVIRRLEDGKQLSGKLSYYNAEMLNGDTKQTSKISFGSAWHPSDSDFIFFSRLDLIDEKSNITGLEAVNTDTQTQKVIHNLHYNRKISKDTQISLHHGIKHIIDRNKDTEHKATIDTTTVELRHDLNKKWDIGVKGGYLRDWTENTTETVAGVSIGVTPTKNAWVELGYNFEGFEDKDFDDSNFKRKGPYASFRYKFDQNSFNGKDLPLRRKQEETSIRP